MRRICAILCALACAGPAGAVTLDEAMAARFPGAAELAARAEAAELRRELAATGNFLAERPTITGWLGARRTENEGSDVDAELEGELPLLANRSWRRSTEAALLLHAATIESAAAAEGRLELRRAYLAALHAERKLALRAEEETLLERWRERLRQVVEAGGAAAFELDLIGLEAAAVAFLRRADEADRLVAWTALAALAELPAAPQPLSAPPSLTLPADDVFIASLAARSLDARYELAAARSQLELAKTRSRFSLLGGAGREGDESVARFGLAFRPFFAREAASADDAARGSLAALSRSLEIERSLLRGRLAAAYRLLETTGRSASDPEAAAGRVVAAIELRLTEGKTTAAEALAVRRQVFELREKLLDHGLRRSLQESEILYFTEKEAP
jgi:hypothetical protein